MKSALCAFSLALCFTLPGLAQDRGDNAREMQVLKEEVAAMRAEMMALNLKLTDMQTLLREMNATILKMRNAALEAETAKAAAQGTEQECEARLAALKTKMDKLLTLGYKPEHPDLRNIAAVIKQLEENCGPQTSGASAQATQ